MSVQNKTFKTVAPEHFFGIVCFKSKPRQNFKFLTLKLNGTPKNQRYEKDLNPTPDINLGFFYWSALDDWITHRVVMYWFEGRKLALSIQRKRVWVNDRMAFTILDESKSTNHFPSFQFELINPILAREFLTLKCTIFSTNCSPKSVKRQCPKQNYPRWNFLDH